MWVATTQGFYRVVQHRRDRSKLLVRARTREDIEALRDQIPDIRTFSDSRADYRWRAVVTRAEWIAALAQLVSELDYPNFKSAVASRQGSERAHYYGEVWSVLAGLQQEE